MRARLMAAVSLCGLLFLLVLTVPMLMVVQDSAVGAADDDLISSTSQLGSFILSGPTVDDAILFAEDLGDRTAVTFTIVDDTGVVHGPDTPRFPVGGPRPPEDGLRSSPSDFQPAIRVGNGVRVATLPVYDGTRAWMVLGRIPDSTISDNVRSRLSTIALATVAALAIALATAWILAGRIAGSVRKAVVAAEQLGDGGRDVEVTTRGPRELVDLGRALRRLAGQIDRLLQSERHRSAELSHRLRTPLTAVELAAERLISRTPGASGSPEADTLVERLEKLESELDQVIIETRAEAGPTPAPLTDLRTPVQQNLEFWLPLAAEQGRPVTISVPESPVPVLVSAEELTTVIDSLVGNIFRHTEQGVGFDIEVRTVDRHAELVISDHGTDRLRVRTSGSTGLGHTVTASIADRAGGELRLLDTASGTTATLVLPLAEQAEGHPPPPPERADTH